MTKCGLPFVTKCSLPSVTKCGLPSVTKCGLPCPWGEGLEFLHFCPLPGERVARDGAFTSRRGPGEGSLARK
jgi:hypothetical protein